MLKKYKEILVLSDPMIACIIVKMDYDSKIKKKEEEIIELLIEFIRGLFHFTIKRIFSLRRMLHAHLHIKWQNNLCHLSYFKFKR